MQLQMGAAFSEQPDRMPEVQEPVLGPTTKETHALSLRESQDQQLANDCGHRLIPSVGQPDQPIVITGWHPGRDRRPRFFHSRPSSSSPFRNRLILHGFDPPNRVDLPGGVPADRFSLAIYGILGRRVTYKSLIGTALNTPDWN